MLRWLRILFRKQMMEDQLDKELRFHIEQKTHDYISAGMSPDAAQRKARLDFGGLDQIKEECRDTGGLRWLEALVRDARYGIRMFRKHPGFTLAVIITLALCIGANTAIYSMLDALVFKPLPFHESDRIVRIYNMYGMYGDNSKKHPTSNIVQYLDFKENVDAFEYFALWRAGEFTLVLGNDAFRYPGAVATSEIFDVLGLSPVLGCFFSKENDRTGDGREIVLTQRFWKSHFQEDPGVIGSTIQVDNEIYEVVGIAPEVFESFNALPQFIVSRRWTPRQLNNRYNQDGFLLGRLKRDATIGVAAAQMTVLEQQALDNVNPDFQKTMERSTVGADALQSIRVDPDLRLKLYLLQGAVLFVLLIGCVNVTNLFLSRSNARQGELAVRVALGSGRRAITRQLLVESFLLTGLGASLGIVLALGIVEIINVFTAQLLPQSLPFSIDGRLLAFTALIAILISLAIGLFQVFHVFGGNLLALTQNQSGRTSSGRSLRTMSGGLVVAQMAITLVLLIGGGLLVRSFANLLAVDPGFNPQHLITARIALPGDYRRDNREQEFRQRLEDSLREIPGITSISLAVTIPYNNEIHAANIGFSLQDYEQPESGKSYMALYYAVDSTYLETMQIPLIEGRWFNAGDTGDSRPVCVVSRDFARQYVSGGSAVGKRAAFHKGAPEENWWEIVGVVGSVRDLSLEESQEGSSLPAIYLPVQQQRLWALSLISVTIRSPRPAPEVIALVREKVKEIDPLLPLFRTGSMKNFISTSFSERRMIMLLLCCFAGLALILSAVGIYGVLAYDVSKRTHEIGIRGAIGATNKQIITMVLRQGLWKAGIGLVIGLIGAFYLSRFMSALLFDVQPTDTLSYTAVSILLLLVALLASYLPARRAARIDPIIALRSE